MIPIRILAPVVHYGHVQLVQDQVLEVPEFLAHALCADDSAEELSPEEYSRLQAECSQATVLVPTATPQKKPRGKRR